MQVNPYTSRPLASLDTSSTFASHMYIGFYCLTQTSVYMRVLAHQATRFHQTCPSTINQAALSPRPHPFSAVYTGFLHFQELSIMSISSTSSRPRPAVVPRRRPQRRARAHAVSACPIEFVLRMPASKSKQGGLLPEDQPAVRSRTVVRLDIRAAAISISDIDT